MLLGDILTAKGLVDSANAVRRLTEFGQRLEREADGREVEVDLSHPVLGGFMNALADDLNISAALGVLLPWLARKPDDPAEALAILRKIDRILGVATPDGAADDNAEEDVSALCRRLDEARAARDYATADALRQELIDAGYEVRTTPEGTTAQRLLA